MDIALGYDSETMEFDIETELRDLLSDNGLRTAVLISLFTDKDDSLQPELKKTYWGNTLDDGDLILGSKLWLLKNEKTTTNILSLAKFYCEDALRWMIEDGVAREVLVTTELFDSQTLLIGIEIFKPNDQSETFSFDYVWRGEIDGN